MTTVIPTEQFVNRSLVFLAPDYDNTIQIVRTGNDDVTIDGVVVPAASFTAVGANSYANVPAAAGVHTVGSVGGGSSAK